MNLESKDAISLAAFMLSVASFYLAARNFRAQRSSKIAEMRREIGRAHEEARMATIRLKEVAREIVNAPETAAHEGLLMKSVASAEAADAFVKSGDALYRAIREAPDEVVALYFGRHLPMVEGAAKEMSQKADALLASLKPKG